jgi:hypothetical protein
MDFSKWRPEILDETEYLVFYNYFVFVYSADDGSKQRYIDNENWSDQKTWIS